MANLALSPVAVAVYDRLNHSSVTSLAAGPYDDVPQTVAFPFVLVHVRERDVRGFGRGGLPEVSTRVHVYSKYQGWKEAQAILAACITRLKDVALTVSGYAMCGETIYDDSVTIAESIINGEKCKELVGLFRIYVEQS